MSTRKAYFLVSLTSLLLAAGVIWLVFAASLQGLALIVGFGLAALFGFVAWLTFFACLSAKPGQTIDNGLVQAIIALFLMF